MSLFDNIPEGTDIIEVRKKVNKMLSEARKKAKPPKCILCGKEQSSFCSRENKWKALCGNYVGGVLGVPHGLLSGGVLLIKMFDKL